MVRAIVAVLLADLVMLAAIFFVFQDVQMRLDCSLPECTPMTRSSPSFSYSFLTKTFSMVVNGRTLVSPLTLDWVQVLGVAFVLFNLWYLYRVLSMRRTRALPKVGTSV